VAGVSATPAAYARDVRVTWLYTAGSVLFGQVFVVLFTALPVFLREQMLPHPVAIALFVVGAALSITGAVLLLVRYRRDPLDGERPAWPALAASGAGAILLGLALASPLLGAGMAANALALLRWRAGTRLRVTMLLVVLLVALWIVEAVRLNPDGFVSVPPLPLFAAMLAPLSALSLWWWDIVRELDRARRAEGRLAAAQERLRLASDLHDLQGHHLQVIALQLELADRMMARDPAAAAEQVRAARASVDEARRGTRELATRFRGVPLPDELANAADLLRAAGLEVDLDVAPGAEQAPADVLGPVVRESTTNVLKHGGGRRASLALRREGASWVFAIDNDLAASGADPGLGDGAGLAGVAERVGAVGGEVRTDATDGRFHVSVRVPTAGEGRP
jgi:two-component system, NarL family, sensor histidine kinase DesK